MAFRASLDAINLKNIKLSLFLEPIKTTVPLSTNIFTLILMSKDVLFKQINITFL